MRDTIQFKVELTGSKTKQDYRGLFTVRMNTTHMDTIRQDEVRRTMLGFNAAEAGEEAARLAHAYAYMSIRLTGEVPTWFKSCNLGLASPDDNMFVEVNNAMIEAMQKERDAESKAAEKASDELKAKRDPDAE